MKIHYWNPVLQVRARQAPRHFILWHVTGKLTTKVTPLFVLQELLFEFQLPEPNGYVRFATSIKNYWFQPPHLVRVLTPHKNGNNKRWICSNLTVFCAMSAQMWKYCWWLLLYLFLGLWVIWPSETSVCTYTASASWSLHRFSPRKKADHRCKDKVNLDDVTKPKWCPSFRCSSALSKVLCYPVLSPESARRLPTPGNQQFQPEISIPFANPLAIPLHWCRALRIQHPTAPCTHAASHCSAHPRASLPAEKSTVC